MNPVKKIPFDFEMVHQLSQKQIRELRRLYPAEWWSKDRKISDIKKMLEHSDIVIGLVEPKKKKLVGFTRVLTDYVYKALVFDVIVAEPYRNRGLGKLLMEAVLRHPALKKVEHIELYCLPELIPFYQQWGFTEKLGRLRFLRKNRR